MSPEEIALTAAARDELARLAVDAGEPRPMRHRAGQLVAVYDHLAAAPIGELSPIRRIPATVYATEGTR